jgi:hypothetical protein
MRPNESFPTFFFTFTTHNLFCFIPMTLSFVYVRDTNRISFFCFLLTKLAPVCARARHPVDLREGINIQRRKKTLLDVTDSWGYEFNKEDFVSPRFSFHHWFWNRRDQENSKFSFSPPSVFCSVWKSVSNLVPFACIQCRTKRMKINFNIRKRNEKKKREKFLCGGLKGPLAGRPYGPPSQLGNMAINRVRIRIDMILGRTQTAFVEARPWTPVREIPTQFEIIQLELNPITRLPYWESQLNTSPETA